jgi:hypothetical protein
MRHHPCTAIAIHFQSKELAMSKELLATVPAILLALGTCTALAGETINESGTMACVTDKWDEKEPEKGHKLVEAIQRCVLMPDDAAAPKVSEDCKGNYEYMPDGSWKGSGTCTDTYVGGGTMTDTWEEGSHLKEYTYKKAAGTGKYKGATGSGTYMYENLTDTLAAGRYKGTLLMP